MSANSKSKSNGGGRSRAALLWDESFLWGVMACKALAVNGLAFDLVRADDVRKGMLEGYKLLFVPGGWASNKMKALGDDGTEQIREFVRNGGNYAGFCGGAGLATLDGLGLLPVRRRPTKERVPSFSGPIMLESGQHPVWQGITEPRFHAWWPSQFLVDQGVSVLATYGRALPDSFSSDLNVGDIEAHADWAELERLYQINLDPKRLLNEPAVIEGRFGSGTVLLSLVHFDTPGDGNGSTVLRNMWRSLGGDEQERPSPAVSDDRSSRSVPDNSTSLGAAEYAVADLIDLGRRHFLWYWRNPMLLQWRRGVRGLEYCTLSVMLKELAEQAARPGCSFDPSVPDSRLDLVRDFAEKAKQLLVRERVAMQSAHITYERCDDRAIQALREELFSRSKSHGGLFKKAIDGIDELVYDALSDSMGCQKAP